MKGILYKNIICIKKQLIAFIYIVVGLFVISTLFALSFRFGNIHAGYIQVAEHNPAEIKDINNMAFFVLLLSMLLPLAMSGEVASGIFTADKNAHFYMFASSMPISIKKRVLANYLCGLFLLLCGIVIDFLLATALSRITGLIPCREFIGYILSFASLVLIYMTCINCFSYWIGNITQIQLIIALLFILCFILANISAFRATLLSSDFTVLNSRLYELMNFLKYKFYVPLLIGSGIYFLSFFVSVLGANRKRGVA